MDGRFQGFLLAVLIGALCRQSMADTKVSTAIGVAAENLNNKCTKCTTKYDNFKALTSAQAQCESSQEFTVCVQAESTCNSLPEVLTFNSLCTIGVAAENLNNKCTKCATDYASFTSLTTVQAQCASSQEFTVCVQAESTCNSLPEVLTFNSLCTIGVAAENLNNKCTKCATDYASFTSLTTVQAQCASTQQFTVCVQTDNTCKPLPEFLTFKDLCMPIEIGVAAETLKNKCTTCATDYATFTSLPTVQAQCASPFTACVQKDNTCKSLPEFLTINSLCKEIITTPPTTTTPTTTTAGNSAAPSMASFHLVSAILLLLVAFVTS